MEPAPVLAAIEKAALRAHVRVIPASPARMDRLAASHSHQGVIAIADPIEPRSLEELVTEPTGGRPPFIVVMDGVTDPQNLGAISRSAECAGATSIVIAKHRSAKLSPSAAKAASGAIEYLDFALVPGIPAAVDTLNSLGVATVGLDGAALDSIRDVSGALTPPVALILGSEGGGLGRLTRQRCSVLASIRQHGEVESLNVAAAAAIALFEIASTAYGNQKK